MRVRFGKKRKRNKKTCNGGFSLEQGFLVFDFPLSGLENYCLLPPRGERKWDGYYDMIWKGIQNNHPMHRHIHSPPSAFLLPLSSALLPLSPPFFPSPGPLIPLLFNISVWAEWDGAPPFWYVAISYVELCLWDMLRSQRSSERDMKTCGFILFGVKSYSDANSSCHIPRLGSPLCYASIPSPWRRQVQIPGRYIVWAFNASFTLGLVLTLPNSISASFANHFN